jgi:hypothetical protein
VRYRAFCAGFFEFEVGFQRFAVHKSLVTRISLTLSALVKNGMRDSSEKLASRPDVDEATFARFVEFMYTGDYNAAKLLRNQEALRGNQNAETDLGKEGSSAQEVVVGLEPNPPFGAPPATEEPADFDEWGGFGMSKKDKKRLKQRDSAMSIRPDRPTPKLPQLDLDVAVVSPLPTSSLLDHHDSADGSDYTALFFCHAKLYVLAEKYGVEHLKKLCSDRLNRSFVHYEHTPSPSADIPGLLRYVFKHTSERHGWCIEGQTCQSLQMDTLQELCVRFAANNTETLVLLPSFHQLLHDGGSFVGMYVDCVAKRLTWGQ